MDNIKEKLKKIKELADKGVDGEAIAAQAQLEKLLEKHGLTIEDLFTEKKTERGFKVNNEEQTIFTQVLCSIVGNRIKEAYNYKGKKSVIYLELTDIEYIDVSQQYEFHKNQLAKEKKKMLKDLEKAYVYKHNIFNCDDPTGDNRENKTSMTLEEYLRMKAYQDNLEDVSFRKQLNQ